MFARLEAPERLDGWEPPQPRRHCVRTSAVGPRPDHRQLDGNLCPRSIQKVERVAEERLAPSGLIGDDVGAGHAAAFGKACLGEAGSDAAGS